ncbi:MAG: hypothetical protein Q9213_005851 [Squamulea squamosa]
MIHQAIPADMRLHFNPSPTGVILLIVVWSLVRPLGCLPTTTPSAYVTELSDGQVQVQIPLTSAPGNTIASSVVPTQTYLWVSNSGSTSSTTKAYNGLTGSSPSTGANVGTIEQLSSLAVSTRTQSTHQDGARGTSTSKTHGVTEHDTKTKVSKTQSSDHHFEDIHSPRSSLKQDAVIPTQDADDASSSTDGWPLATRRNSINATPTTLIVSVKSSSANDNRASIISPSFPNPSDSELHHLLSLPVAVMTSSSSQTEAAPFSKTDVFKSTGKTPIPTAMGYTDPKGYGELSLTSNVPVLATSTEAGALNAPTQESAIESPAKLTYPTPSMQAPVSSGSSSIRTQISTPASMTGASTTGTFEAGASIDGSAEMAVPSLAGAPSNRQPTLPKIPVLSQGTQTTESSPLPSVTILDAPTATWTTAPRDMKLGIVTNPVWTKDTLITTTSPGSDQPTLMPVFANCEGCGPGGSLVVFGQFQPLISYHLPKTPGFPPVPRFHLPCIAFCPSSSGPSPGGKPPQPGPPERDEEHRDDDKDKNEDNQDDDNEDKPDAQNDEEEDDNDDDQDDDRDGQQSTAKPTAKTSSKHSCTAVNEFSDCTSQPSTVTGTSSGRPSSTGTSSSTGTGSPLITDTAYIDDRPTDVPAQDRNADQYLLAAYSSLGIADKQIDFASTPAATTAMPTTSLGDVSTVPSNVPSSTFDSASSASSSVPSSTGGEVEEAPPAESPDPLKCHGVAGDVWMIHRDQAVSAAEQFCMQDTFEKEYFQGSVDELTECVDKFKIIIDSCDGDNPVNNPHNYKFGGMYSSSGWEYKLRPLALKPTENSCDITYEITANFFEIRGKNFPDGKLGAKGEGLKKEINGCGALTFWEFDWTPNDVKYQWYASGYLPIGTKSCVGSATQTAGGKSAGHCKGAG